MLESALDPFAEVPEDPIGDGQAEESGTQQADILINKFLADLRDMDVLQQHQELFKEKQ